MMPAYDQQAVTSRGPMKYLTLHGLSLLVDISRGPALCWLWRYVHGDTSQPISNLFAVSSLLLCQAVNSCRGSCYLEHH